jgi:hypothetical protein
MKHCVIIVALLVISFRGVSQTESQVKWTFESQKKQGNVFEIILHATIAKPWHIYSQFTPEGGPLATQITFASNPVVVLDGSPKEVGDLLAHHDENFGVDVRYFSDRVDFVQIVKPRTIIKTSMRGSIEYMICNDTKCLPPVKQPFTVEIQ